MPCSFPKAALMGHVNLWDTILRMSCSSTKTKLLLFYLWEQRFSFFSLWDKVSYLSQFSLFKLPIGLQLSSLHALQQECPFLMGCGRMMHSPMFSINYMEKRGLIYQKIYLHHSLTNEFRPGVRLLNLLSSRIWLLYWPQRPMLSSLRVLPFPFPDLGEN